MSELFWLDCVEPVGVTPHQLHPVPPCRKINLVVATIMETSTVDLHVSVTHLLQLRLVSLKLKSKANTAMYMMDDGGERFCIYVLTGVVWTVVKRLNAPIFLKQTNQQSLSTMIDTVWTSVKTGRAVRTNSVLHTPQITTSCTVCVHCRTTVTPLLWQQWRLCYQRSDGTIRNQEWWARTLLKSPVGVQLGWDLVTMKSIASYSLNHSVRPHFLRGITSTSFSLPVYMYSFCPFHAEDDGSPEIVLRECGLSMVSVLHHRDFRSHETPHCWYNLN